MLPCWAVGAAQDTEYGASGSSSWIGSLVDTIVGNLKISFSNVHIRYEDPGGYCLCLRTLSADALASMCFSLGFWGVLN